MSTVLSSMGGLDFGGEESHFCCGSIIYRERSRKIQFPSVLDAAQELRGHLSGFLTDVSPSRPIPVSSVGANGARKVGALG